MKHKLLPYTEEDKCAILRHFDYTEESLKEDIGAIIDWFEKQPHLADAGIDPGTIRTILFMAKGSREKAKRNIDYYYKIRGLSPGVIQSRKEALLNNQILYNSYCQAVIPKLYDGRRVTVLKFDNPDPSSFSTEEITWTMSMVFDLRVSFDYFRGDIWVIDLKSLTIGHYLRMNPILLQRGAQAILDGIGVKVHAIHILNFPSFGQQLLNLFRKFVKAKIMDRIVIHSSVEELHKVLPKTYLPKDYGGVEPSMQEFKEILEKELHSEETKQFILEACKKVTNEKKRPGDQVNEEFLAGTFRSLNLD